MSTDTPAGVPPQDRYRQPHKCQGLTYIEGDSYKLPPMPPVNPFLSSPVPKVVTMKTETYSKISNVDFKMTETNLVKLLESLIRSYQAGSALSLLSAMEESGFVFSPTYLQLIVHLVNNDIGLSLVYIEHIKKEI